MVGRSVGRAVGRSVGRSVGSLVHRFCYCLHAIMNCFLVCPLRPFVLDSVVVSVVAECFVLCEILELCVNQKIFIK